MIWSCEKCGYAYVADRPAAVCPPCGSVGSSYFTRSGAEGTRIVTMTSVGDDESKVVSALTHILSLELADAKKLAESCPVNIPLTEVEIDVLQAAGAKLAEKPEGAVQKEDAGIAESEELHRQSVQAPASQMWSDWTQIPAGHTQATTALREVRAHADAFRGELAAARKDWTDAKELSQKTYDSETASARSQYDGERAKAEQERDRDVKATEARSGAVAAIVDACASLLGHVQGQAHDVAASEIEKVKAQQSEVMSAIAAKISAYRDLCELQITQAEKIRNDKLDKARQEQIERDSQDERRYKVKSEHICDSRRADIGAGFGKDAIQAYVNHVSSFGYNAENFECPVEVPEFIRLGEIGLILPNESTDDMSVVQAFELQAAAIGSKQEKEYIVQLPYAQRVSDGISLMMRYSQADRSYVQGMIQPLLLKLFMSFPAGKLEATMIDPLELGASFIDIPRLGSTPDSARIIDTKIWSKDKDIEQAISRLRQRLENITQSYGGDQESRLKKESIRALAITDFPVGFTETALKDLHAIVRNGAALGVCVLICANDDELEKLKQRHGTLVKEIAQSLVETKAKDGYLMLEGRENAHMFLRVDQMEDAFVNKDKILSTISAEIDRGVRRIEHFEDMFGGDIFDSNSWFVGEHDEIAIPIGIKGADNVVKMVVGRGGGSTAHHALVAGPTGAGKSTFLHTLIMSALVSYSPDDLQMYLLDFKEGVEFSAYTRYRLPSLRVVALNSEREFGLNVLKELCAELETRAKNFNRYGASEINDYIKLENVPKVPRLLLVFDEVQELFRAGGEQDSISAECLSCINRLVMQGRAMGIHIILACQDFHNCAGLENYFSNIAIRVAIRGDAQGASSILGSDNKGVDALQSEPAGAAIYNNGNGVESANNPFQISYLDEADRLKLLTKMDAYFADPDIAPLYADRQTRILITNAEENIYNCFNQLILDGARGISPLAVSEDGYGLLLGQSLGKKRFLPELQRKDRNNLLVVSRDEKVALSLFELSAMSTLYEELHTDSDKGNALIYIVDFFDGELADEECDFDFLETQFPEQVQLAKIRDVERLISDLYEKVLRRSENTEPTTERVFLMFFGINRSKKLSSSKMYDAVHDGERTPAEMLRTILSSGPKNGVNCVVWSETIKGLETVLGERYETFFDKRIAFDLDDDAMELLVAEEDAKALRGRTAVYMDIDTDVRNTHFRPYGVPAKVWVERFAQAYEKIVREGSDDNE